MYMGRQAIPLLARVSLDASVKGVHAMLHAHSRSGQRSPSLMWHGCFPSPAPGHSGTCSHAQPQLRGARRVVASIVQRRCADSLGSTSICPSAVSSEVALQCVAGLLGRVAVLQRAVHPVHQQAVHTCSLCLLDVRGGHRGDGAHLACTGGKDVFVG